MFLRTEFFALKNLTLRDFHNSSNTTKFEHSNQAAADTGREKNNKKRPSLFLKRENYIKTMIRLTIGPGRATQLS